MLLEGAGPNLHATKRVVCELSHVAPRRLYSRSVCYQLPSIDPESTKLAKYSVNYSDSPQILLDSFSRSEKEKSIIDQVEPQTKANS